jgi:hypothetical protein
MAIGDSGRLETCKAREVVEIGVLSNLVTPASIRWLARAGEDPSALKVLRVRKPTKDRPFVSVDIKVAPFERYRLESGPVMGDWMTCAIRNESEARDPLFKNLSTSDERRILRALDSLRVQA